MTDQEYLLEDAACCALSYICYLPELKEILNTIPIERFEEIENRFYQIINDVGSGTVSQVDALNTILNNAREKPCNNP